MTERLPCCVPFCRRTIARDKLKVGHSEWLCPIHWRCVPISLKARKRRIEKIAERAERRFESDYAKQGGFLEPQLARITAVLRLEAAVWRRCKDAALAAVIP